MATNQIRITYTVDFLDDVLEDECNMHTMVVLEAIRADIRKEDLHSVGVKFECLDLLSC